MKQVDHVNAMRCWVRAGRSDCRRVDEAEEGEAILGRRSVADLAALQVDRIRCAEGVVLRVSVVVRVRLSVCVLVVVRVPSARDLVLVLQRWPRTRTGVMSSVRVNRQSQQTRHLKRKRKTNIRMIM